MEHGFNCTILDFDNNNIAYVYHTCICYDSYM